MSYLPPQPVKSREARQRYKANRRRQTAMVILFSLGLAIITTILIFVVLGVRSCTIAMNHRIELNRLVSRGAGEPYAKYAGKTTYDSLPLDWQVGQEQLFVLTGSGVDATITSHSLPSLEEGWQQAVPGSELLFTTSDWLVSTQPMYGEPPGLVVQGYNPAGGQLVWRTEMTDVADVSAAAGLEYFAVVFSRGAESRLIIMDPASGAKLATPKLQFPRLKKDPSVELDMPFLAAWDDNFGYFYHNSTGLFAGATSQPVFRYAASNYIQDDIYDPATGMSYLVTRSGDNYELLHLSSAGQAQRLLSFTLPSEQHRPFRLLSGGSLVLLVYGSLETGLEPQPAKAVAYELSSGLRAGEWELPPGVPLAGAYLAAEPGYFGLAMLEPVAGAQLGQTGIYVIDPGQEAVQLVAELKQPVSEMVPFKDDCLVLEYGGNIHSLVAVGLELEKLAKARYPLLTARQSPDGSNTAVSATPDELADGATARSEFLLFD